MPTPPQSKTFTADNITGSNIVPVSDCYEIHIYENGQIGSANFTITMDLSIGTPITIVAGSQRVLKVRPGFAFRSGVPIGKIIAASGTMTFAQEEY